MFITENYSSKFTVMFFWGSVLKSPAENGIPKSLDTSLTRLKWVKPKATIHDSTFLLNSHLYNQQIGPANKKRRRKNYVVSRIFERIS